MVTGGASGLGRATAYRMAKKGSQVVFCDLPTSNGESVANEIGENCTYIPADVTSEADIKSLAEQIDKKYGKLDVLVNCAGIANAHVIYNFNAKRSTCFTSLQKVIMVNQSFSVFVKC